MATVPEILHVTVVEKVNENKPSIDHITLQLEKTNGIKKLPSIFNITIWYGKWTEPPTDVPLFMFGGI